MDDFASRFDNKIDAKGRVSIPAPFRTVLAKEGAEQLYCFPHLDQCAVEAGGKRLVDKIKGILAKYPPESPEREDLEQVYFGEAEWIKIDSDGRAILSPRLRNFAGIGDQVVFVGLGDKFQIWEPAKYETFRKQARERVRLFRQELGAGSRPGGGQQEGARE
jgi:MraZ protein